MRAIQAGLKKFGHDVVEDGIYGPQTRGAVADWQVSRRGAARGRADGIARVSDAMHLGFSIGVRTRHTM
ncbi:peptidoglycan-binding domain-containing protein [Microlunatus sp. Y2014]|uniref:peptidoglycan-binding domain-containing protein n=1 Tax=Microlunatus sp. Y2014 TaxID=3418488 RepID=UPI003DA71D1D